RTARAFCPSCGREIRPESARSIANQVLSVISSAVEGSRGESFTGPSPGSSDFARDDGKAVLVTFWVAIPPKTKPRDFFAFLQQQGYLRIWLHGEVIRVDTDVKIERLGARVQVIQDRITLTEQNRARLTEAIETALRFGKGKINIILISENRHRSTSKT